MENAELIMPKFKENEKVLCYHDKLLYEVNNSSNITTLKNLYK